MLDVVNRCFLEFKQNCFLRRIVMYGVFASCLSVCSNLFRYLSLDAIQSLICFKTFFLLPVLVLLDRARDSSVGTVTWLRA